MDRHGVCAVGWVGAHHNHASVGRVQRVWACLRCSYSALATSLAARCALALLAVRGVEEGQLCPDMQGQLGVKV
jgi:hypothetical protein